MSRPATGQVIERRGKRGRTFALRFRAYGRRQYLTLGTAEEGWKRNESGAGATERPRGCATWYLARARDDCRRGAEARAYLPSVRFGVARVKAPRTARTKLRGLPMGSHPSPASVLRQASPLANHEAGSRPLPDGEGARADRAQKENEEARKRGDPIGHRGLSANTINKTLTRLSQILDAAADYDLIPANPAAGKRRRLKPTRPGERGLNPNNFRLCSMRREARSRCWQDEDGRCWRRLRARAFASTKPFRSSGGT
jgi:hypothetical protein